MKYQITCDNCGTQFIVEAEEGQTIECTCPHCHGIMEVTLPLVSAGQQYDQSAGMTPQPQQLQAETAKKGNNAILWGCCDWTPLTGGRCRSLLCHGFIFARDHGD